MQSLKFDPMQPTRQLSRSPPLPAFNVSQTPEIYGRCFNQQEIGVGSPPPEILQGKELNNSTSTFHV